MKKNYWLGIVLAAVGVVLAAGCTPGDGSSAGGTGGAGPTMTAVPLPPIVAATGDPPAGAGATGHPTAAVVASALATDRVTATARPAATDAPAATASQVSAGASPTAAEQAPATDEPAATAGPAATALPPTPAGSATAAVQAIRRPAATSRPAFQGRLVFQTAIGGDFYTINADGSGLRRIGDGVDPAWSPDGTQIAFTRWREPRGVWVVDADGQNERRVFDWTEARWPSWSPDGAHLLFSRQNGGRTEGKERCFWGFCFEIAARPHWTLGIVDVNDGDFVEPPAAEVALAPAWSPDGQHLVYDGEQGLVVQSDDGSNPYAITADGRDTGPAWSPDGRRIAFVRRQHDHWEVYAVDADGRNLARLTDTPERPDGTPGNSAAAAWSPDGRFLAFLTDRTGRWELWVMGSDGRQARPMFATALDGLALDYAFAGERAVSWRP